MKSTTKFVNLLLCNGSQGALVWRGFSYSFDDLTLIAKKVYSLLQDSGVGPGAVIAVEGDFTPSGVGSLLALMKMQAIAVPMTTSVNNKKHEFYQAAEVEWTIRINDEDEIEIEKTDAVAKHNLILALRSRAHPGLILFSSGTTGKSKAVLHDWELLVTKYLVPRHCYRTIAFLLFDHIGGIDTLYYNLANGSPLIATPNRLPETVCATIEKHRVEVLPVSPTFLNLLLMNGAHLRHDLSSLKIISYGAEVMPETTLERVSRAFPNVRLLQKFGTTEVGTLRSKSRESGSPWVKIGGEGYETRIVNGMLEIKAESAMLGYLNAPSPFTNDGWFITGDAVEVDGEFMRILGRNSELINVGGEKVYPSEVESVLIQMPEIVNATVFGEPNPITGQIVAARIELQDGVDRAKVKTELRKHCSSQLARYKVPVKIFFVDGSLLGSRFKKTRKF